MRGSAALYELRQPKSMGQGKIWPLREWRPLNRLPKNLSQLITSGRRPPCQRHANSPTGSFSANRWNITETFFYHRSWFFHIFKRWCILICYNCKFAFSSAVSSIFSRGSYKCSSLPCCPDHLSYSACKCFCFYFIFEKIKMYVRMYNAMQCVIRNITRLLRH